ncbi:MAG: hypothetical protein LBV44_00490 [Methylobacillus sp.]|nr:hypothetical protein [Methylobacillus sp.]
MSANAWAAKARQLDRYRWQVLRAHHAWAGSFVRFLRDAIVDAACGFAAKLRLAAAVESEPCDFLLLQAAPRVIKLQRKKTFMAALRERGHSLTETALPEMRDLIAAHMLRPPSQPVPLRYFAYAAHAAWLVEKYQPRILLNDRNGSFYSPFLRLALNARGGLLVQLAHSTTVEASRRLGMNDYDYYFLFGKSSLEALQARKLRCGTSIAVLVGSHMVDESYALPLPDAALKTVLVLGLGPDKEKLEEYQATYRLLRDWAERHTDYRVLIKKHPRSVMEFWEETGRALNNVHVLPPTTTLAEALGQASVAVNIVSNAAIEAALARRPILYVSCGHEHDLLSQARFFNGKISTMEALEQGVDALQRDYPAACQRSAEFAEYHLAYGTQGLRQNIHELERLLTSQPPEAFCETITNTIKL